MYKYKNITKILPNFLVLVLDIYVFVNKSIGNILAILLYNYKNITKILPDFLVLVLDIIFHTLDIKTLVILWYFFGINL